MVGPGGQRRDVVVGDAGLHEVPPRRHAHLALVGEGTPGADRRRGLDVDVVEHEQRRVAAELEVHALEVLRRQRGDGSARASGPVNAMTRTAGSVTSASPTSAPPGRTCSRPSGSPAAAKISARTAPPLTAVLGSGLSSTALPSARAGATARMDRIVGTLNGAITPTTPTERGGRG